MTKPCLAAPLALFLLAGCLPTWVSPTTDDAASLTFVPEATGFVHAYLFADGRECKNQSAVSGFGGLKGKTEIKVPPGQELAPNVVILDANWRCSLTMSFVPQPRQAYAVLITGGGRGCKMGIARLEGTKFVPEPSARARKLDGSRCE